MLVAPQNRLHSGRPTLDDARHTLQSVWGYADFRYHQSRAVLAALQRRDCLGVLPTGGGKSLCYQVPALLLRGVTLVVSPLISLMQDQVTALRKLNLPAAYLSSTQRREVRETVHALIERSAVKLLYVAPERLPSLMVRHPRLQVSLLAVDEAHCISEWGHEFRPHYRSVGKYRRLLGNPPVMALTATATPETRRDVAHVLRLVRPVVVSQSFDRPNLRFVVHRAASERGRVSELLRLVGTHAGTAIAYVPTRTRADAIAATLRLRGVQAAPYHAALPAAARKALLARFLDGRIRIIVATNAFGMGIDKPDVRLVVHLGVPPRPETYFQEAGRAGRDGGPARCIMFWMPGDLVLAARMCGTAPGRRTSRAHLEANRRALATMRRYVRTRQCRRKVLLQYLGERMGRCSGCDRCCS